MVTYRLEQLFNDHDPDIVADSIPALLSMLDPLGTAVRPIPFPMTPGRGQTVSPSVIEIDWDHTALRNAMLPRIDLDLELPRWRTSKTLNIERQTELAGYGLAMVAAACILARRVEHFNLPKVAPDLIFNIHSLPPFEGLEAAARSPGTIGSLRGIARGPVSRKTGKRATTKGKRAQLRKSSLVAEAYISLWALSKNTVGYWEKAKP